MNPKISVIIPAFNAEKTIAKTLESLEKQAFRQFEAIVVNDGSADKTEEIAESFNFAKVISQKNMGISASRNIGAKNANAEIIAFLDADAWVEEKWVEKMLNAFKEKNVFCACGEYSSETNGLIEADFFAFTIASSSFQGYNIAFRKKEFLGFGGFNEAFKYSEEPEFFFRVFGEGKKLKQIDALSVHSGYSLNERLKKNFEYSKWDAKTLKRHWKAIAGNPVNFFGNAPENIKNITLFYFISIVSFFLLFFNPLFVFLPALIGLAKFAELKSKVQFKNSFVFVVVFAFFALTIFVWIKFAGFLIGLID